MDKMAAKIPEHIEKKLRQNGYHNHTPEQRSRKIEKAIKKLHKRADKVGFKVSCADVANA